VANKSDGHGATSEERHDLAEGGELTTEDILRALIDESVRSRLRHRALLNVLVQNHALDLASYVSAYQTEEEANFGRLLDMLLMKREAFRAKHGGWLDEERKRLGHAGNVHQGVSLTRTPLESAAEDPATPGKAQKPKRRTSSVKKH
jgi:hypothetical protein